MYSRDTVVAVRPFTQQREGEEIVIGNPETGVFLALPPDAVELLDLLARGKSVGEVTDLYFQKTGETPDIADLLSHLQSKGLVGPPVEGLAGKEPASRPMRERRYHFSGFPQPLARFLCSRPVLACEVGLMGLALAAILSDHALMPVPADWVFEHQRALSWTLLTVFTYFGIFLHEMAHLVAARSLGVSARMGISHRLWDLVAETDLTGLWAVPRDRRYLPLLAGIILDATIASIIILWLSAARRHLFYCSLFELHLLRALVLTSLMRILWEFSLFVRTDLYFVAAAFLNCKNLLIDTKTFLRNQLARVTSRIRVVDQSAIPATERRAIRTYAVLFVAGRTWAFATLFWVFIPVCRGNWNSLTPALRSGYSSNPAEFIDALVASAYFFVPTLAGFVLWAGALVRPKGVQL